MKWFLLTLSLAAGAAPAAVIEYSHTFGVSRTGGPAADVAINPDGFRVAELALPKFDAAMGTLDSVSVSISSEWANAWAMNFYLPGASGAVVIPDLHRLDVLGLGSLQLPTGNGTLACTNTDRVCTDVLKQSGQFNFTIDLAPADWTSTLQFRAYLSKDWSRCTTTSGTTYALSLGVYTECVLLQDASNGVNFNPSYAWDGEVVTTYHYTPASVPEAKAAALLPLTLGLLALVLIRKRFRKAV